MVDRTKVVWMLGGLLLACLMVVVPLSSAAALPGVSAKKIVFGQSACFSGHNQLLGLYYRQGILAAFAERNRLGGVNGKILELISLDDGYEPTKAMANARRFASENDVLAVIGGVRNPDGKAYSTRVVNCGNTLRRTYYGVPISCMTQKGFLMFSISGQATYRKSTCWLIT